MRFDFMSLDKLLKLPTVIYDPHSQDMTQFRIHLYNSVKVLLVIIISKI